MTIHGETLALVVFLFLTTLSWNTTSGVILQARKAGVSLPSPLAVSTAIYDEEDSVYIFGG
jgi:hypothetical protein